MAWVSFFELKEVNKEDFFEIERSCGKKYYKLIKRDRYVSHKCEEEIIRRKELGRK